MKTAKAPKDDSLVSDMEISESEDEASLASLPRSKPIKLNQRATSPAEKKAKGQKVKREAKKAKKAYKEAMLNLQNFKLN